MKKVLVMFISIFILLGIPTGCASKEEEQVTIGYFPNLTHIATIVGLEKGYFEEAFGKDTRIQTKTFHNGGLFMEAMQTKEIDVGTVGPAPLLNIYVKNPAFHIISGAVNGGAVLVAEKESQVNELTDLEGKKVAIPVIGSTQDIMLRKELQGKQLKTTANGGTVELFAAAPAETVTLFNQNAVDAAATQEPWGYTLETQADGKLLLDWDEFAWGKESTNTVVAASSKFVEDEKNTNAYLEAHLRSIQFIQENPIEAQELVMKHIKDLTGKEMNKKEIKAAFNRLEVTTQVNKEVIQEMATISKKANYIDSDNIKGLFELSYIHDLDK